MQNSPKFLPAANSFMIFSRVHVTYSFVQVWHYVQIDHLMTGHFASEASGPQKLHKYILRDLYASSLGKKTFLKVSLTKAKYLRQSERYKTVYISPDRSPEERETHKLLVLQLKNKRDTDRESHHFYFIRDGKICSVPKTDNNERV